MYDSTKVLIGLGLFVVLFGFPFWSNLGHVYKAPELEKAQKQGCVEDPKWMRANHMKLLDEWRLEAVRDGKRMYVSKTDGKVWEASLQKTCLSCHTSTDKFCTECHTANSVNPFCWDCHVKTERDMAATPVNAVKGAAHGAPAAKSADKPAEKKEKGHE